MMHDRPQHIGLVLDSLVADLGISQKLQQYGAIDLWNDVVGEQISKVTTAEKVDNGVLIVKVSAAPWRTELVFRKREILDKLHARMNSSAIKDIRFR